MKVTRNKGGRFKNKGVLVLACFAGLVAVLPAQDQDVTVFPHGCSGGRSIDRQMGTGRI